MCVNAYQRHSRYSRKTMETKGCNVVTIYNIELKLLDKTKLSTIFDKNHDYFVSNEYQTLKRLSFEL